MNDRRFEIDPDVRQARTLPAAAYTEDHLYARQVERVFVPSWQLLAGVEAPTERQHVWPYPLLPGCLDEPLVLTSDAQGELRCLSNVCTHRGNLLAACAEPATGLRCRYHGRRFSLDGRMISMPEFEQARDFPSPADNLPSLELENWGPLHFVSVAPETPFGAWLDPVRRRMDWFDLARCTFDPKLSREYTIEANWALYCDNYLEGFHIPFVHHSLAAELEYGSYRTETFEHSSLQVGIAQDGETVFDLPSSHPDQGQAVAAYYFFLFPNLMLNFYPWGLSVNLVQPVGVERTRVQFLSYVVDPALRMVGAGADLHRVELEDEEVIENVQRGVRSRLYRQGRFSPTRETAVHHFHRFLASRTFDDDEPAGNRL